LILPVLPLLAFAAILGSVLLIHVRESERMNDHISRSLVAIAASIITAFVALYIYNTTSENNRRSRIDILGQQLRRFAIYYAFDSYQIQSTRHYCIIRDPNVVSDAVTCRQSALYAASVGRNTPPMEPLFLSLNDLVPEFVSASQLQTKLIDGDITSRARMPTMMETGAEALIRQLSLPAAERKNPDLFGRASYERLIAGIDDAEYSAEITSMIFCMLASAIDVSPDELSKTIGTLNTNKILTRRRSDDAEPARPGAQATRC
jgi:hypothetical protein